MNTQLETLLIAKLKELNRLGEGTAVISAFLKDGKPCISLHHDAFGCTSMHTNFDDAVKELLNEQSKIDFALKNFADLIAGPLYSVYANKQRASDNVSSALNHNQERN
jgi:hypothetical protein